MDTYNKRRDPTAAKQRDMARSILPSKRRRTAAKSLDGVRRAHRRGTHQRMAALRDVELFDDLAFGDLEGRRAREIRWEVQSRRYHDKDAPLRRWAVRSTRGMRQVDRLSHLEALLPLTLIGFHAIGHLKWEPGLADPDGPSRRRRSRLETGKSRPTRAEVGTALRAVLEFGDHRAFNCFVTRAWADPPVPDEATAVVVLRPLLGLHDIDGYLDCVDIDGTIDGLVRPADYQVRREQGLRTRTAVLDALCGLGYLSQTDL